MAAAARIFDDLSALADPIRSRLLLLVERHELTVTELCQVVQLPQSTVSRHLKTLADEGWVAARADGASRRYSLAAEIAAPTKRLWQVVREQTAALGAARQDAKRLESVLVQRRTRTQAYFSNAAGRWDKVRAELLGPRGDLVGLLGLLDESWTVGDLGCGTGHVADLLAPFVGHVIAIDESTAMLAAARRRLAHHATVEVKAGALDALPLDDGVLDAAVMMLVLPYLDAPGAAIAEAARVLAPGGRLVVLDLLPHEREEYRHEMGHERLGVSEDEFAGWCAAAGLGAPRMHALAPDPQAKGPSLFVASVKKRFATLI